VFSINRKCAIVLRCIIGLEKEGSAYLPYIIILIITIGETLGGGITIYTYMDCADYAIVRS
jgi:hypothetical protein